MISIALPAELTSLPQFVLWRYEDRGGVKLTKVPITCQGYRADVTDPANWSRYDYAVKMAARPGFCAGIGFVFAPDDPFTGIDLDDVWPSDAAETPAWAQRILDRFNDTYSEESPSGQGAKIWSRAKAPRCGSWKVEHGAVEVYSERRFFTVTGRSNRVLTIADHQEDIEQLVENLDGGHQGQPGRIEATIPHGTQHRTLISLAGTMHRRGICPAAIEAALQIVNKTQCEKPGPEKNIRKIVADMAKKRR